MNNSTFQELRTLIHRESGISLADSKQRMLEGRLSSRIRELGLEDETAYLEFVAKETEEELVHLLDAVSTNVTKFFREPEHFSELTKCMNEWFSKNQNKFRIWCAASSTGQEPYTLAITLAEVARERGISGANMRILATDISTRVLRHAIAGTYNEAEVASVPKPMLARYFSRGDDGNYTVVDELRQMVVFRRLNLSQPPFPMRGPMDAVFCRNVMFYFEEDTRLGILRESHRLLRDGGLMALGMAESLPDGAEGFDRIGSSVFRKSA